jgi:hypothetical protein
MTTQRGARQMAIVIGVDVTDDAERMKLADDFAAMLYPPGTASRDEKIIEFVSQVERAADNPQDYTSSLPATRARSTWAEDTVSR